MWEGYPMKYNEVTGKWEYLPDPILDKALQDDLAQKKLESLERVEYYKNLEKERLKAILQKKTKSKNKK